MLKPWLSLGQSINFMRGLDKLVNILIFGCLNSSKCHQGLKFSLLCHHLMSSYPGRTMSEEEERMSPFFSQTCPSRLPSGSHEPFWGIYLLLNQSLVRKWDYVEQSVLSLLWGVCPLEKWQASEQNWSSSGNGGGRKHCIHHLLFLCFEAVDNGAVTSKTFSPKFHIVWSDG